MLHCQVCGKPIQPDDIEGLEYQACPDHLEDVQLDTADAVHQSELDRYGEGGYQRLCRRRGY
jgi:hypothetical protein